MRTLHLVVGTRAYRIQLRRRQRFDSAPELVPGAALERQTIRLFQRRGGVDAGFVQRPELDRPESAYPFERIERRQPSRVGTTAASVSPVAHAPAPAQPFLQQQPHRLRPRRLWAPGQPPAVQFLDGRLVESGLDPVRRHRDSFSQRWPSLSILVTTNQTSVLPNPTRHRRRLNPTGF